MAALRLKTLFSSWTRAYGTSSSDSKGFSRTRDNRRDIGAIRAAAFESVDLGFDLTAGVTVTTGSEAVWEISDRVDENEFRRGGGGAGPFAAAIDENFAVI